MSTSTVGISFKETMTGGFSLGATDPKEGRKEGRKKGNRLELHGTITIDDLDRFISDPDHTGSLAGTVDFTPWGDGMAGSGGIFNLFKPTDDPDLKLMVYELPFSHGGQSYYLAGQKDVRDDPIWDLWKQTTTLYTHLYQGTDKSGPVVGAGVLSLGVVDLIKLVSTLRAPGASGPVESAEAIAKFGKFFMGELWESYVVHAPSS